jgi:DMSO reductase family type II enzyme chaperone
MHSDPPASPEVVGSANRSRLYLLFAEGFRFPSAQFHATVQGGAYRSQVFAAAASLPYKLRLGGEPCATASEYVDFQAEYIRLFDVGAKGRPPCALYEGEYRSGGRMQVMEELVRFYEHFGLALSTADRELPDHLSVELEFLHYLTFKEAAALERGVDPGSYRRAERDFLTRHPSRWLPAMRAKAAEARAQASFRALIGAADEFVRADLAYLRRLPMAPPGD